MPNNWKCPVYLNDHKFKHNFSNCTNLLRSCSLEVESTAYFFLHCLCFSNIRKILFNELISICEKFIDIPDFSKVGLLFYGNHDLSFTKNSSIINASINYITKSKRSKGNLFWTYFKPKLHLVLSRNSPT